jgi:hypothetical protein
MKRFNSSKWITENKHGKNLTEGMSPEEWDGAKEKERLNQHPEKDKINKIKKMMDKEKEEMHDDPGDIRIDHDYYAEEKTEDYKPSHRAYNVIDKSNNDKIVAKELSRDKALELAKTNKDYMIDATDRLAETRPDWTPPPMGMGGEDEEQDEYDKGWYGESLKEVASKLGYLKEVEDYELEDEDMDDPDEDLVIIGSGYLDIKNKFKERPSQTNGEYAELGQKVVDQLHKGDKEAALDFIFSKINEVDGMEGGMDPNAMQYEKVTFVYTEQGGRFYGLDVYVSKDQPQRSDKLRYDEANEWLKDTLHYIHEDDLIPRKYISGLEDLDLIVERLKELDIEASHNDFMDVS